MNRKEYTVIRYDIDKKFYVEVIEFEEIVEFWLCANGYGIKELMYGIEKEICQPYEYKEWIDKTVYQYIYYYIKEYFEIEW